MPDEDLNKDNTSPLLPAGGGIVHAVSIKLPDFWTKMPAIWFIQVESQFSTRSIVSEETKFHYVVQSLPQDVAASVYDILIQKTQTPYTNLKKALIERHSMSESKRIEALLSGEEMGDKKPSEFYRRLQTLAGQSMIVTESLILELWKRRLPTLVQVSIKSSSKTKTDELLEIADDIFEVYQKQNSCFSMPSHSERSINELTSINQNLQAEISEIKTMLSNLNFNKRSSRTQNRTPFSRYSDKHSRNRSNSKRNSQTCWFHQRYGNRAIKCSQPCNFKNMNPN
ncbi:uncharacterized protein LOC129939674 [Eupeodes corollae]|uniref:uncharacterized protein LOC129939674 n=1 Tax=Eupeodes corollae TaxID=290404 RepID=UPI002492E5DD|nr:uncharacterized protein LOC129939674 [Eupeodes corollae]